MILRLPVALTVILSLATVAFSGPTRSGGRKCGNEPTPEEINERENRFADALSRSNNSMRTATNPSNFTIPVYFHVIDSGVKLEQGCVPDKQIQDQIAVLNKDFAGTGLGFKLINTSRTTNAGWFKTVAPNTAVQTEMKKTLRRGGPEALNLFTVSFDNTDDDGVVLRYSTLPGGTLAPFDLGRTATHEIGHWVGLYHTFQSGCGGGDMVSDTTPEASPAFGCPSNRDTCRSESGKPDLDPVHNYMDYTDDSCMNNFTEGQIVRLRNQILTYLYCPIPENFYIVWTNETGISTIEVTPACGGVEVELGLSPSCPP